jgi:hypothetical protein
MLRKILRKMFHKIPEERFFERCFTRFRRKDASQDVIQDSGGKMLRKNYLLKNLA